MVVPQNSHESSTRSVLVLGGGFAGMTAALMCLQAGVETHVVEREPSLGGLPAQLGFMFPSGNCLLCRTNESHGYGCPRPVVAPQFLDFAAPDLLHIYTSSTLVDLSGTSPHFEARVRSEPEYVNAELCIACGKCAEACPVEVREPPNDTSSHKAIHVPVAPHAVPERYVLERELCPPDCQACANACPTSAIDLKAQPTEFTIEAGAVIVATGADLFDPRANGELAYGRFPGVVTGLEFERLVSRNGPTEGRILRSDGLVPQRIAWLQCVGSRDDDHQYCSSFCCMYATKQAVLAKEANPDLHCSIFLMDNRTFAKDFTAHYEAASKTHGIDYIRCRISSIKRDAKTGKLYFRYVNNENRLLTEAFDMVVLSVGVEQPAATLRALGIDPAPAQSTQRTSVFQPGATIKPGVFVCGNARDPKDLADTANEAAAAAALALASVTEAPSSDREETAPLGEQNTGAESPQHANQGIAALICDCPLMQPLDTEALADSIGGLSQVKAARSIRLPCLPQGREEARSWLANTQPARLVVAACSTRTHKAFFERLASEVGLQATDLEYVPLATDVVAVHHNDGRGTRAKATASLRSAIARAATASSEAPPPIPKINRTTLIIGGGASGLTAAHSLADLGCDVVLVEREEKLGGNLANIPVSLEEEDLTRPLQELIASVQQHPRIQLLTNSTVKRSVGTFGHFRSLLSTPNGAQTLEHGALIVASGGTEYAGTAYGLGTSNKITTLLSLEGHLRREPDLLDHLDDVVFISCVGPWDEDDTVPWRCSRTCCDGILRNAIRLKRRNPEARVRVLVRETMTIGSREKFYTEARRLGVIFTRFASSRKPKVVTTDNALVVSWYDPGLAKEVSAQPSLLVLAAATMPRPDSAKLAADLGLPGVSPSGFFTEREVKVAPYSTAKRGVFVVGLAQAPKPAELNIAQGLAAAQHAANLLAHPERPPGHKVARVDQSKCVACLTCVRICPYHVPEIDHEQTGVCGIAGAAWINPLACEGCGACCAECPQDAITLTGYESDTIAESERAYQLALLEAAT